LQISKHFITFYTTAVKRKSVIETHYELRNLSTTSSIVRVCFDSASLTMTVYWKKRYWKRYFRNHSCVSQFITYNSKFIIIFILPPQVAIQFYSAWRTPPLVAIQFYSARRTSPPVAIQFYSARKTSPPNTIQFYSARKTSPQVSFALTFDYRNCFQNGMHTTNITYYNYKNKINEIIH
jgi:hypothetical protein